MSSDEDGTYYELTMPFVVIESQGGPFSDEAFVAGMTCGQLWVELQTLSGHGATPRPRYIRPEYLPQVDLIAMHFGYTVKPGDLDKASGHQRVDFGPDYDKPDE